MIQFLNKTSIITFAFLLTGVTGIAQSEGQKESWSNYKAESFSNISEDGKTITITSEEELALLAEIVNTATEEDAGYNGYTIVLDGDLDLSDHEWIPIGDMENVYGFLGTFNGNGHTISGIKIQNEKAVSVGLFGFLSSPAMIKNLTVKDSNITGAAAVGALAGIYNNGSGNCISNCHVLNTTITGAEEIGGIIGGMTGGVISNCTCSNVAVNSEKDTPGVLVGFLQNASMIDCYSLTQLGDGIELVGKNVEGTLGISLLDKYNEGDIHNQVRISNYADMTVNVTLSGRTLCKDNSWNTLCLPFKLEGLSGTPLEGATIQTLASSSLSEGELTLTFCDALNETASGTPYIVKWPKAQDVTSPIFKNVTIVDGDSGSAGTGDVTFQGIYEPFSIGKGGDNTILYLGAGNTLYYPSDAMTIGACRAYFQLDNGITAGNATGSGSPIRSFNLNFGEDLEDIAIVSADSDCQTADNWYTLDGRKLSRKLVSKGIYLNAGRKVIIK